MLVVEKVTIVWVTQVPDAILVVEGSLFADVIGVIKAIQFF